MKDINPVSTTQKQRLVSVANANDTIINTNYNMITYIMHRDGNLDPTRGYPARPDSNGPDFTWSDKE